MAWRPLAKAGPASATAGGRASEGRRAGGGEPGYVGGRTSLWRVPARASLLVVLCLSAALTACGSDYGDGPPPAQALNCMHDKGVVAKRVGGDRIEVGRAPDGPTVIFHQSRQEAESRVIAGQAAGAEEIERALVYPNSGSDRVMTKVETCLERVLE
jgi:hypothetical protein